MKIKRSNHVKATCRVALVGLAILSSALIVTDHALAGWTLLVPELVFLYLMFAVE